MNVNSIVNRDYMMSNCCVQTLHAQDVEDGEKEINLGTRLPNYSKIHKLACNNFAHHCTSTSKIPYSTVRYNTGVVATK